MKVGITTNDLVVNTVTFTSGTDVSGRSKEILIDMEGVKIKYGQRIILGDWTQKVNGRNKEGLWWRVRRGQRWGLFGPNGNDCASILALPPSLTVTQDRERVHFFLSLLLTTHSLTLSRFGCFNAPDCHLLASLESQYLTCNPEWDTHLLRCTLCFLVD